MRSGARCIALAVALVALAATPASANESNCTFDAPPAPSPRLVRAELDGLTFNVLLPSDYASGRRYPVLYLLHGGYYNENTWLDQSDVASFTAPFTGGQAAIVVMPDGGPLGFYIDWHDGTQQWETYHVRRLIPYVDAHFRTIADRAHRAVAGFSIGGFGAAHYAARHPDLFVVAGDFSGLSHLTVPEEPYAPAVPPARTDAGNPGPPQSGRAPATYQPPTDGGSGCNQGSNDNFGDRVGDAILWHNHNPTDLAPNFRGVSVYVASGNGIPCGPGDAAAPPSLFFVAESAALVLNQTFDRALSAAGVPHTADFYGCGLHDMLYAQRDLHAFWSQMVRAFGAAPPGGFDYRTADPDFSVWGWTFHADGARAREFLDIRHASSHGATLTGSGTETVLSPRLAKPGQGVRVTGAKPALAHADARGQITVTVDLGPANSQDQFKLGVPASVFTTRRVNFTVVPQKAKKRPKRPRKRRSSARRAAGR